MNKRVKWIDITYGLMMLLVVIGHTLGPYASSFLGSFIFAVHMPILFILMGYLFQRRPYKVQFRKSCSQYLVPYVVTGIVVVILNSIALALPQNVIFRSQSKSLLSSITSVLYGAGSQPFNPWEWKVDSAGLVWVLLAMFLASQLFNLIMRLADKRQQPEYVRLIVVILLTIIGGWLGKTVYLPWSIGAVFFVQSLMYMGYAIKKTNLMDHLTSESYILFGGVWIMSGFIGYFNLNIPGSPNLLLSLLGAFGGSICIFRVSQYFAVKKNNIILKMLEHLGQCYLIVICLHLIDSNYFEIDHVLFKAVEIFAGSFVAVIITVLYRLLFVAVFVIIIPKIPGLNKAFQPAEISVEK